MANEMNIIWFECAIPLILFRWNKFELVIEIFGEDNVKNKSFITEKIDG